MKTLVKESKPNLTDRQITCLKILKRAPKTTTKAFDQIIKINSHVTKGAVHGCMRGLENRNLVRARSQWDKKLKRDVIVWELTSRGRKALEK
jgi:DNA-binding PadR family transcriptional regulator